MSILRIGRLCMPIASLKLPDNFKKTVSSPRVRELQKTVSEVGILQPPMVREHDRLLIYGAGRVAALMRSGVEDVDVDLVECSDDQVEMLRAIENGARVHNPDQKAKDILAAFTLMEAQLREREPGKRVSGPGRSPSVSGDAKRAMAEADGVTPNAIKQRIHRAKKREEEAAKPKAPDPVASIPEPPKPPPIETFGLTLDEHWCDEVRLVQDILEGACRCIRQAKAHIVDLRDREVPGADGKPHRLPVRRELLDRFLEELALADTQIKGIRPHSLCPMCKGQDGLQEHCGTCAGHGHVTKAQEKMVDKAYLEQPVVCVDGKPVPLSTLQGEPEPVDGTEATMGTSTDSWDDP